jgi:hypothetical protein
MTNGQANKAFLESTDETTCYEIIKSIAKHYGASLVTILDEVISDEAEHLLDYMTGPERSATYILMQKKGMA